MMQIKMKRVAAALGIVLGLATHQATIAQTTPGISSDNRILIGVVAPLSGPVAYAGRATVESIRMYIDSVNKEGGASWYL
jgi:ABC-type branched-subunit amino acid transport system substrate-binding protein